MCVVCMMYTW